jgi:monoamine oxidase
LAEIKSALELALEKAEKYGRASAEEMALSQYQDQGRQLAVLFLKGEGDLEADLKKIPPTAQPAVRQAIKEVFLRNLALPRENTVDDRQDRALEGLLLVADNKKAMAHLQAEMEQVLQQFLQIRNNAMQQLKARYADGVGQLQKAMEAQLHQKVRVEAENLPQFQEEWRRFQGQLQDQVDPMLENLKARMRLA